MNFKFDAVLCERKLKAKSPKKSKEYTVVGHKIIGLCCITLEGDYYIKTTYGDLKLTKSSFKKKCRRLYAQNLIDGKNLLYVPLEDKSYNTLDYFLPFAPSIYLIGNVIEYIGSKDLYFDLIESLDFKDDNTKEQFKFYKEHYEEIHANYICKVNTQQV